MADENSANSGDPTKEPEPEAKEPVTPPPEPLSSDAEAADIVAGKVQGTTPGQRLAAKKALKATQKRDFKVELKREQEEQRIKEQEEADRLLGRAPPSAALPQSVDRAAGTFTHFLQDNRSRILLGAGALIAAAGLVLGLQRFLSSGAAEQAAELGRALDLVKAPVDADDADGKSDDGKPLFKSEAERAAKVAAAFGDVIKADEEGAATTWAKLGQGAAQLALGKFDEARASFKSAGGGTDDAPEQAARVVEGDAVALEAQGKVDEALKGFEQLQAIAGQKELGEYHVARLRLAKGDREGAKALLKSLYDALSAVKEDSAPSPYLKSEVELRLAEIDSSLVDLGSSAQQPQQFSDEQLQRLLQQLQNKGKAPGAAGE